MIHYKLDLKGASPILRLEIPGRRGILYLDTVKGYPEAQSLIKHHLRINSGKSSDTLSFQEILLPLNSTDLLRPIVVAGCLFFKGKKLSVGPKESFIWRGEKHADSISVQGFIGSVPIEGVDFLGTGWAIVADRFIEVETPVEWKKGPLVLEGVKMRRFLDEQPKVIWKEAPPLTVHPVLALTDPTGCFANLWFDYGGAKVAFDDFAPQVGGRSRLKKEEIAFEKDLVESGYQRKVVGNSRYYTSDVKGTLRFLLEMGWTCLDMKGRKIHLQSGVDLHVGEEGDRIGVRGCIRFEGKEGSLQLAQKKGLFLELDGESVGLLDMKDIPLFYGDWDETGVSLPKRQIGEVMPLLSCASWEPRLKKAALGDDITPVCLDHFRGTLFPYQKKGVEWLNYLYQWGFGALLSDEMGLGKTVQVLAFFSHLRTNLPILIVAPTSLLFNWKREIEQFWQGANVYVHSGPDRLKSLAGQSVVLTSYALLRIDQELFSSVEFEAIALDESQAIKTAGSQASEVACSLKGKFKIAITGTPVENRREELWSQFRFMMPELLGSKSEFAQLEVEAVRRKIKPFVLRRLKADVQIDLPEKMEEQVWLSLTEEQQGLYLEVVSGFRRKNEPGKMEILEAILRLRQISCDPRIHGGISKGSKAEWVVEVAENLKQAGKKGLIFSQFTSFLRVVQKDLEEVGISPLYLDGSTPAEERGELVRRFQEEDQPHLFLLSLKAGGVGLNLTAAEDLILLDPWWNDAVERQAIDRAHRIGQKRTLLVHRLLTPDSIEEKMVNLKARKTAMSDELLTEEASSWTPEELLDLIY